MNEAVAEWVRSVHAALKVADTLLPLAVESFELVVIERTSGPHPGEGERATEALREALDSYLIVARLLRPVMAGESPSVPPGTELMLPVETKWGKLVRGRLMGDAEALLSENASELLLHDVELQVQRLRRMQWLLNMAIVQKSHEPRDVYRDLALSLRSIRQDAGLTQEEIAVAVDMKRSTITNFEQGHRRPSIEVAVQWAEACGYELAIELRPRGTRTDWVDWKDPSQRAQVAGAAALLLDPAASHGHQAIVDLARVYDRLPPHLKAFVDNELPQWLVRYHPWATTVMAERSKL